MKNKNYHFPVALIKEACPLCGKAIDGPIIIGRTAVTREDNKVERMHGRVVGMSKEPCSECKEIMEKAFLLVGVVESKTDDKNNPYRSGNIWGVRKEVAKKMFGEEMFSKGAAFIDVNIAQQMGLPDVNLEA